jgi:phage terminase small subunit
MDGKKAVVEAGYNCTNKSGGINWNLAHVIASENLKKPTIYRYIDILLEKYGLSDDYVDKQLLGVINQWSDLSAKVRAIDILYKKRGSYAPEKHENDISDKLASALERMAKILPAAGE